MQTQELAGDGEDTGYVIVSLHVFSNDAIAELDAWRIEPKGSEAGPITYKIGTISFEEPCWERRIDALQATIDELLDRLANVPRARFHEADTFSRLYLTLPAGAETISAETVKRLAEVNAVLWIDA